MTCKQLYGPCDALIHGETSEEMMANSQKHGMEMAANGDQDHIKIMAEMRHQMENPEAVKHFMDDFVKAFNNLPEDK